MIESKHWAAKQEGIRGARTGPASISLSGRFAEIEARIEQEPAFFLQLADACEEVRSSGAVLKSLNLEGHPAITREVDEGDEDFERLFEGRRRHRLVEDVVYRRDASTQFMDLTRFDLTGTSSGTSLGTDSSGNVAGKRFGNDSSAAAVLVGDVAGVAAGAPARADAASAAQSSPVDALVASNPRVADTNSTDQRDGDVASLDNQDLSLR